MSLFRKKDKNLYRINELQNHYRPASLPSPGNDLECRSVTAGLEGYVPGRYTVNTPEFAGKAYAESEKRLKDVVETCDHHVSGEECDQYIDAQIEEIYASLANEIPEHEDQCSRISATRKTRIATLKGRIAPLEEEIDRLNHVISPLKNLRSQFTIHMRVNVSIGIIVTLIAMVFDAFVNYSYFQTILYSNFILLWLVVMGCSLMSDASMCVLGIYMSRKEEQFTSRPVYYLVCSVLFAFFAVSVLTSMMVRFGSMPETFGTVNAEGEFIHKSSYSLAEYGVTIATSLVTAITGILSFAFSNDRNSYKVSIREKAEKERNARLTELEPLKDEVYLLENAPDPFARDHALREAAVRQIEALRTGLKLHVRKLLAEKMNDPGFTEKMSKSGLVGTNTSQKESLTQSGSDQLPEADSDIYTNVS